PFPEKQQAKNQNRARKTKNPLKFKMNNQKKNPHQNPPPPHKDICFGKGPRRENKEPTRVKKTKTQTQPPRGLGKKKKK
ncbi:hypothetical protein, partial [Escherichia coli]|uniref:hypothetical protein n=1 Tax=Escherichia coli TaxID=562 RepID=UPI0021C61CC5